MAVQCLYTMAISKFEGNIKQVMFDAIEHTELFLDSGKSKIDQSYLINLVTNVVEKRAEIDPVIQLYLSKEWRFERIRYACSSFVKSCSI